MIWAASFLKPKKNWQSPNHATIYATWANRTRCPLAKRNPRNLKTNYIGRACWKRWIGHCKFATWISLTCRRKRIAIHWIHLSGPTRSVLRPLPHRPTSTVYHRRLCLDWCLHLLRPLPNVTCRLQRFSAFSCITKEWKQLQTRAHWKTRKRSNFSGGKFARINSVWLKDLLCGMNWNL